MVQEMLQDNISKLRFNNKIYQYIIPIQSAKQLVVAIVRICMFAAIFYLIVNLFAWLFGFSSMTMLGAFFVSIFAVYFSLYTLLSTDFTIAAYAGGEVPMLEIVASELRVLGYEPISNNESDAAHYRKKGANRLHWEEDDFYIGRESEKITIKGPLFTNDKLRKCLLKSSTI